MLSQLDSALSRPHLPCPERTGERGPCPWVFAPAPPSTWNRASFWGFILSTILPLGGNCGPQFGDWKPGFWELEGLGPPGGSRGNLFLASL